MVEVQVQVEVDDSIQCPDSILEIAKLFFFYFLIPKLHGACFCTWSTLGGLHSLPSVSPVAAKDPYPQPSPSSLPVPTSSSPELLRLCSSPSFCSSPSPCLSSDNEPKNAPVRFRAMYLSGAAASLLVGIARAQPSFALVNGRFRRRHAGSSPIARQGWVDFLVDNFFFFFLPTHARHFTMQPAFRDCVQ